MGRCYVLITPARNEERFIEHTIRSVVSQTVRPAEWVIVSDRSTDRTDEIVNRYSREYGFIRLLRVDGDEQRNFGSKALAFTKGYLALSHTGYEFIGNLDADVTLGPDYYEDVICNFNSSPRLGIAGGIILELAGGRYEPQNNSLDSVAGAIQLFRRDCFEEIGGYLPISTGGIDSAAEISARMHGWKVRTFEHLKVYHHRLVSSGRGSVARSRFRHGITHYLLGYHPLFELVKCAYRFTERPFALGSTITLAGFTWAAIMRYERPVSEEFVKYLRREQAGRASLGNIFKYRKRKARSS
ncbi:MAG: glycosyltransferase family 2 protein [Deltaproteobacteria bacterium]|nr:glycosyltransferase family 2 protein [Deltaproteobacteria bacterium]